MPARWPPGLLLLDGDGIFSSLRNALPGSFDARQMCPLAERIATGNLASFAQGFPERAQLDPSGAVVHAALVHGFRLVMLHGGAGIWVLAAISFASFGNRRPSLQASGACP